MDKRIYTSEMIDTLKKHLNTIDKYITYPKFVFMCGKKRDEKYIESNRGVLEKFFKSKSNDIHVVVSEYLWSDEFSNDIDLLTFEDFLAEISDLIVLFVESFGTSCELGAFAYTDDLFDKKMLVVIDEKYKNDNSFISKGPVTKLEKDGCSVIYAKLDGSGLLASNELRSFVCEKTKSFSSKRELYNKIEPNSDEKRVNIKSFIMEILDLATVLQPISKYDLLDFYKSVKGFSSFSFVKSNGTRFHKEIKYDYILRLLDSFGLIWIDDDTITCDDMKIQSFLFLDKKETRNRERNRLLCRQYRYKGQI